MLYNNLDYECDYCGKACDGTTSTECGDVCCSEECMIEYLNDIVASSR